MLAKVTHSIDRVWKCQFLVAARVFNSVRTSWTFAKELLLTTQLSLVFFTFVLVTHVQMLLSCLLLHFSLASLLCNREGAEESSLLLSLDNFETCIENDSHFAPSGGVRVLMQPTL